MCLADHYDYMTSNSAESINNLTRHVRKAPITQLMEWYRALLQKWYCARRDKYKDSNANNTLSDWATHKVMDRTQKNTHWKLSVGEPSSWVRPDGLQVVKPPNMDFHTAAYTNNYVRSQEYEAAYTNNYARSQEYEATYTNNYVRSQEYEESYTNNYVSIQEYEAAYNNMDGSSQGFPLYHATPRIYKLPIVPVNIFLVKVRWNSRRGPKFTWEREDSFKKKYPHLFTKRASSSTTRS
ncbi:hypothetical protein Tco_1531986 [Tanacetum coccineum]